MTAKGPSPGRDALRREVGARPRASTEGPASPISPELLRELMRLKIRTKHMVADQLQGAYTSIFRGQGLSFSEVRSYQPGDDVRRIDWNLTARSGDVHVRNTIAERELETWFVIDGSATAMQRRLLDCRRLKKGERQVMRVIREILGHRPAYQGTNLKVALETLIQVTKRRSVAFLISDFFAGGFERSLALAAAKYDINPVMIVDPRDDELPDVGLASFQDLETGEEVLVDTSSRRVRDHYRDTMRGFRAERERLFKRLGLDAVVVKTSESVVGPLRKLFERRARRRR